MPLTLRQKLRVARQPLGWALFCAAWLAYDTTVGWWWLAAPMALTGAAFVWLAAAKIHRAERERRIDTWWALVDKGCSEGG